MGSLFMDQALLESICVAFLCWLFRQCLLQPPLLCFIFCSPDTPPFGLQETCGHPVAAVTSIPQVGIHKGQLFRCTPTHDVEPVSRSNA